MKDFSHCSRAALQVGISGIAAFSVGALWYSDKTGMNQLWCQEAGITEEVLQKIRDTKHGHGKKNFLIGIIASIVAAGGMVAAFKFNKGVGRGALTGAKVGTLFVATSFGINYSMTNKSFKLWAIDAGYHVAQFITIGASLAFLHGALKSAFKTLKLD